MIEKTDEESWQIREVYTKYGVAMYFAQCFETGLVNLLVVLKLKDRDKITRADIDAFMRGNYKKTLGQLISLLKREMEISEGLENDLKELLEIRNYLAHRYFRVKAVDFMKRNGCQHMVSELECFVSKFKSIDMKIESITFAIAQKYGIKDETIGKIMDGLLKGILGSGLNL